jgi:hypothetical protein
MADDYLKKFAPVATHLSSPTSATKSVKSRHDALKLQCPLCPLKADIRRRHRDVSFGPKADIGLTSVRAR